jgi:hypothetical protein
MTFDDVKRLARDLPEVEEETSYGTRALKVKKKHIVRVKEDGETLVVRCDTVSRDMMLRGELKLHATPVAARRSDRAQRRGARESSRQSTRWR